MPNEPKVRTRTRTRRGGDIVKTKTVTKGDGMKRVEKSKTKIGPGGDYMSKSVIEKRPMGRSVMTSYAGKMKDGGSFGGAMEKIKSRGGMKTKRTVSFDKYSEPAASYTLAGGRKVSTPAYSSMDKTTMVKTKGKGMKSKMTKTTVGGGYDVYGKYVPEKKVVKSKKSK